MSLTARLIIEDEPVDVEPVDDDPADDEPIDLPDDDPADDEPADDEPADEPDVMEVDDDVTPDPRPSLCGAGASSAAMVMLGFFAALRFHRASPVSRRRR